MFGGYTGLKDMVDGGGAGRSGDTFQGGGLRSGLLNAIGVRPLGYNQRQAEMQQTPQRRPMMQPPRNPMMVAPPPRPDVRPLMPLQPISVQPLMGNNMPMDEWAATMLRAINSAPQAQPQMSREQLLNIMRGYY